MVRKCKLHRSFSAAMSSIMWSCLGIIIPPFWNLVCPWLIITRRYAPPGSIWECLIQPDTKGAALGLYNYIRHKWISCSDDRRHATMPCLFSSPRASELLRTETLYQLVVTRRDVSYEWCKQAVVLVTCSITTWYSWQLLHQTKEVSLDFTSSKWPHMQSKF